MSQIKELKEMIAVSLWIKPCNVLELLERDFLKNKSRYGVDCMLMMLDGEGATYYTNKSVNIEEGVIHIKKKYLIKSGIADRYELVY